MIEHKTVIQKLLHYINLDGEVDDFEVIQASIEKDIRFMNIQSLSLSLADSKQGDSQMSLAVQIESYIR